MENPYKHLKAHEGDIFKYRDLCNLLGVEFKSGKGKQLQLNKLRQFLDLDQDTVPRRIVLKKVYDDNEQKVVGGKGKYLPFIKNILLNQLHSTNPYIGTYNELIPMLGLASQDYVKARYEMYSPDIDISQKYTDIVDTDLVAADSLSNFLSMTGLILKEIVRSSLNQLQNKNLISVERSLRLYRQGTIDEKREKKRMIQHHDLSPAEHDIFVKIGTDLVERFHLSGRRDLFYRKPSPKTALNVQELYKDRLAEFITSLGYEFSGTLFIISATSEGLDYEIDLPYLNHSRLMENIFNRLNQDKDLKKVIPQPMLEKFIGRYFSSPFYHC